MTDSIDLRSSLFSRRTARRTGLHFLAACLLSSVPAAAQPLFEWIGPEERIASLGLPGDPWESAPIQSEASASRTGTVGKGQPALAGPSTQLLLPYFEVDAVGSTDTTLIGLQNVSLIGTTNATIQYFDAFGNNVATEAGIAVNGAGVYTRNLRDVAGLPTEADGYKRGFAIVSASGPLSGDYFQVDPVNAFASGSRLVDQNDRCFVYGVRFLAGGAFTGGTQFHLYVDSPLGIGASDPPTASFTISAEDGTVFGDVAIRTDRNTNSFSIGDVLRALPGSTGPVFGSAIVAISASAGYGLLDAQYSADGLYSVGLPASCHTPGT